MRLAWSASGDAQAVTQRIGEQAKAARLAHPAAGPVIASLRDQVISQVQAADVAMPLTVRVALQVDVHALQLVDGGAGVAVAPVDDEAPLIIPRRRAS